MKLMILLCVLLCTFVIAPGAQAQISVASAQKRVIDKYASSKNMRFTSLWRAVYKTQGRALGKDGFLNAPGFVDSLKGSRSIDFGASTYLSELVLIDLGGRLLSRQDVATQDWNLIANELGSFIPSSVRHEKAPSYLGAVVDWFYLGQLSGGKKSELDDETLPYALAGLVAILSNPSTDGSSKSGYLDPEFAYARLKKVRGYIHKLEKRNPNLVVLRDLADEGKAQLESRFPKAAGRIDFFSRWTGRARGYITCVRNLGTLGKFHK